VAHRFGFETEEGMAGGGGNDGGSIVGGATMDITDGGGARAATLREEMMLAVTRTKVQRGGSGAVFVAVEVQVGAARHDGGATRRDGAMASSWYDFGAVLGVFGSYLGVERNDYRSVATDDDFLVTCGLAVKGIMWLRKWFQVVELCFTCLLGTHLGS